MSLYMYICVHVHGIIIYVHVHINLIWQVRTCDVCQRSGRKLTKAAPELHPVPVVAPWHHIGIDFVGPLSPPSTQGSHYILTISDYFSKLVEAIPTVTKHATVHWYFDCGYMHCHFLTCYYSHSWLERKALMLMRVPQFSHLCKYRMLVTWYIHSLHVHAPRQLLCLCVCLYRHLLLATLCIPHCPCH